MNKFIKLTSEKIKAKIMKNPYSLGLGIVAWLLIIPMLIWIAYYIGDSGYVVIHTSSTVDGLLSFYGSFLSFIGTIALGALALWQNRKFKAENDKSQERLQELATQANEISQNLMNLEKDKFRPYIRIDNTEIFLAISKGISGFRDEIENRLSKSDIKIRGCKDSGEANYEKCSNSYYPECIAFSFRIQNIGQATIAGFSLERLYFVDGVTGIVKEFRTSMDTSILNEQKNKLVL